MLERCGGDGEQHHGNARRRKQRGPSRLARECVPGEQAHEAGDEYGAFVGHSFHALHSSKCAKSRGKGGGTAPASHFSTINVPAKTIVRDICH